MSIAQIQLLFAMDPLYQGDDSHAKNQRIIWAIYPQ